MNNPFVRLKHYRSVKIDPRENHATECLAACLAFSPRIAAEFIKFLFGDKLPFVDFSSGVEVNTQHGVGDGWIDLVLIHPPSGYIVVVEAKVGSLEDDPHHRSQLGKYAAWLAGQKGANGHIFTLVQNPKSDFPFEQYQVKARRTWKELHERFQNV